jgi:succinyl-diaminopimelate desuccinylase
MPTGAVFDDIREAAEADHVSVIELTQQLVRTPSRGGIDDYRPVVDVVTSWLATAGLGPRVLRDEHADPVAVTCEIRGSGPGPHYLLDACLDTAAYGDEAAWSRPPDSGVIDDDGWMHGRGTSDSKVAVAIFSHIAARLAVAPNFQGTVSLLFDLDEHTGGFAGIRAFLEQVPEDLPLAGAYIGYPGPDTIVIGGRGMYRSTVTLYGQADHSASKKSRVANAIVKATRMVDLLQASVPTEVDDDFGLPPKATVTWIEGGIKGAFSIVPDRCQLDIDVRLTPSFTAALAAKTIAEVVRQVDREIPAPRAGIATQAMESWPPYKLTSGHPLSTALEAGARAGSLRPRAMVAGPSNIGNLLHLHGIPATAGFGVEYRGLHGTDEAIRLRSVPRVQEAYHRALLHLSQAPVTTPLSVTSSSAAGHRGHE